MKITRHNYEAFLLDRLERTLSEELNRELELFLIANPDIETIEDGLPAIDPSAELNVFEKNALKKQLPPIQFNLNNIDDLLVAKLEGDLLPEQLKTLDEHISSDETIALAWREMQATKCMVPTVQYPNKRSLKKGGVIIPFRPILAMAATIALLVGLFWWLQPGDTVQDIVAVQVEETKDQGSNSLPDISDESEDLNTGDSANNEVQNGEVQFAQTETTVNDEHTTIAIVEPGRIARQQLGRIESIRSVRTTTGAKQLRSVEVGNLELALYDEPNEVLGEDGSQTVSELAAGIFRKEVLEQESDAPRVLDRMDAYAAIDRGLRGLSNGDSGLEVEPEDEHTGRRRFGLKLGDLSISASLGK